MPRCVPNCAGQTLAGDTVTGTTETTARQSPWRQLPAFVRAIVMGGAVAGAGTIPWLALVSLNLQRDAAIPWSVALMAVYLILYWIYLRGAFWPRATSLRRRELLRAEPLSARAWNMALLALVLGFFAAFAALMGIYARLVTLPAEAFPETGHTPWYVVLAYIAMIGVVAGVAEEAGYRGYMQVELERAYGPTAAIAVSSLMFTLAHWSIALAPFILTVAIVLGVVAYLARSIVPGLIVHGAYDFMTTALIWRFGYPPVERIDLTKGVDEPFIIACTLVALAAAGSLWAMTALARERRKHVN